MEEEGLHSHDLRVTRKILHHIIENPGAKDTKRGIRWWLQKDGVKWGEEEVREAIKYLVSKEWLIEKQRRTVHAGHGIFLGQRGPPSTQPIMRDICSR